MNLTPLGEITYSVLIKRVYSSSSLYSVFIKRVDRVELLGTRSTTD